MANNAWCSLIRFAHVQSVASPRLELEARSIGMRRLYLVLWARGQMSSPHSSRRLICSFLGRRWEVYGRFGRFLLYLFLPLHRFIAALLFTLLILTEVGSPLRGHSP